MLMPNFLPNSRRSFNIYNYLVFHLGSQKLISVDLEVDIDSYFLSSIWHLLPRLPLLLLRNSSLLLASLCAGIVSFLFFFSPPSSSSFIEIQLTYGFPGGSVDKESACNARDPSSIPRWEDPLEEEMATNSSFLA